MSYFTIWHEYSIRSAFWLSESTSPSWNNASGHGSVCSLLSMKYLIAWNRPTSCCNFCLVDITSAFFSKHFCLFPVSVASTWASTSGWVLREVAFSLASTRTRGSCTVRNHLFCSIPHWCWRSTQSSIVSPNPPGIFFICHWTCLSTACIFGVMGHCKILLPLTATNIKVV